MQGLIKQLDENIKKYERFIKKDLLLFKKSKSVYWNKSYGKELIIIFNKNNLKSFKNIGFPFPLISEEYSKLSIKGISIMCSLTGDPVLNFQRNQLINDLQNISKVELIEIDSLEKFQDISEKSLNQKKSFNYYDPYSFIGDSFIGLHFPETFELNFKCKLKEVYSENYSQLNSCIKSKGYINLPKQKNNVHVFADLIANQWNRTKYLVKERLKEKEPCIIIGRDLILIPDKDMIKIYYFKREGVLLRDTNIEDYMNECLMPFVRKTKKIFNKKIKINSNNLMINPFGSSELKTIPVKLIKELIKKYKDKNKNSKILIITGFKHNYSHLLWAAQLRDFIIKQNLEKEVILKDYGLFDEIKKDIIKYKIKIGLTADTSISHLFNYIKILNLTFYNTDRIDLSSPQSLASDSPLGFCRYDTNQIPILFSNKIQKNIIQEVLNSIDYFKGNTKDISWTKKIFDDKLLIKNISKENTNLIEANHKISPFQKIK